MQWIRESRHSDLICFTSEFMIPYSQTPKITLKSHFKTQVICVAPQRIFRLKGAAIFQV